MTRDVLAVSAVVPLAEAWQLMKERGIRHLPVVETGVLVGIVSDRDLLLAGKEDESGNVVFPATFVGEIMSVCLFTCTPTASVSEAARLMIEKKIDALPVVQQSRLVGLVTSSDLLDLLRDGAPQYSLPFDFRIEEVTAAAA